MTSDQLAAAAGIILSLAFSYIPQLRDHYNPLASTTKRLIMLGLLVLVAVGAFSLSCVPSIQVPGLESIACTEQGALGLLYALVAAVVANQSIYAISPRPDTQEASNKGYREIDYVTEERANEKHPKPQRPAGPGKRNFPG